MLHSDLNVKGLVGAFNQEKALVGAFSVIVQLYRLIVYSSSVGTIQSDIVYNSVSSPRIKMWSDCNVLNVILSEGNNLTLTAADGVES